MTVSDIQSPFDIGPTTYKYSSSAYQTGLVRPYESIFQDELIKDDFYRYYRGKLDQLVDYYQKNSTSLTDAQEEPLKNILDLL